MPHIPEHGLDLSSSKTKQRPSKKLSTRPEDPQQLVDEDRGEGSSKGGFTSDASVKGKTKEPELDTATYQPELSRKQRAKVRLFYDDFPVDIANRANPCL